jgi:uncharacterized spore protein YtfJ
MAKWEKLDQGELLDRLRKFYTVERVYGEPMEIMGKTIIPVARVGAVGGAGGGEGETPLAVTEEDAAEGATAERDIGSGMGFGFGGGATPVGFLVVEEGQTKWVPIVNVEKIAIKALGVVAAIFKAAARKAKTREGRK